MSDISDLIIPLGVVLLGAYGIKKIAEGYKPYQCSGQKNEYCLAGVCVTTCASPGTPGNPTPVSNNDNNANGGGTPSSTGGVSEGFGSWLGQQFCADKTRPLSWLNPFCWG